MILASPHCPLGDSAVGRFCGGARLGVSSEEPGVTPADVG